MVTKIPTFLSLFCLSLFLSAQEVKWDIDDIIDQFNNAYLRDLGQADSLINDIQMSLENNADDKVEAFMYYFEGLTALRRMDFVKGMEKFNKAIPLFESQGDYCNLQNCYFNIATVFDELGDDIRAVNYYRLSESIRCDYDEDGEENLELLFNLMATYHSMGLDTLAKKNIEKILSLNLTSDEEMYFKSMAIYFQAQYALEESVDTSLAMSLFNKAIDLNRSSSLIDSKHVILYASSDLSVLHNILGDRESASYYSTLVDSILNQLDYEDLNLISYHRFNELESYLNTGQIGKMQVGLSEFYHWINEHPQLASRKKDIYRLQISLYEEMNKPDSILKYTTQLLESIEQEKKVELKYQSLLLDLDDQIRNLALIREASIKKEKRMMLISIGALIIVLLVAFIALAQRNKQIHIKRSNKLLLEKNAIIERKNEELEELNQEKGQVLRLLSHDIRTPLSNMKGILEVYSAGLLSEEELREYTDMAKSNLEQLQENLDNLIKWSVSQLEGISVKAGYFELKSCVQLAINYIQIQSESKGIEIVVSIFDEKVYVDRDHLEIIIRNLVSNAIKFSPRDSIVAVSSKRLSDDQLELSIEDNGVGMDIQKWEQVKNTRLQSTKGTEGESGYGLGLSIVHQYAKLNHIDIQVNNKKEGGTVFYLNIPTTKPIG